MTESTSTKDSYAGFEQGPIRPPSEAQSLLIRVTRNCPWNRCTFCPVYKGTSFSIRPVEHVKKDIDAVHRQVEMLRKIAEPSGYIQRASIHRIAENVGPEDGPALAAALHWFAGGMASVFLQDANSLVVKPADLVEILNHLSNRFPWPKRITSYARSRTLARMKDDQLRALRDAGLNRLHIGLESGSDQVLETVQKGATKRMHVQAGLRVKRVGIELSEYYMPGLGGKSLSEENARETADAMNQINPDFIRLRPLAIANRSPLFEEFRVGRFSKCTDIEVTEEVLTFLGHLEGITSTIKSDHILNLFADLEGTLPGDKEQMMTTLRAFLSMAPERQRLYQVGRRLGLFSCLHDMEHPHRLAKAERAYRELGVTAETIDHITDELVRRFI
jgi:hypothetical protein